MLECVVNISEGRDRAVIDAIADRAGPAVVDVHCDPWHHRSVLTLLGTDDEVEGAVRHLAEAAVEFIDLRHHHGAHPRLGALDVVPFVALGPAGEPAGPDEPAGPGGPPGPGGPARALAARRHFAGWAAESLALPCFFYGPERTLPEVRRRAFADLAPDVGPSSPHPTAGACAVGARPVLVAYNLWLARADLALCREIAVAVRGPHVRALGLRLGERAQVSCNLLDPSVTGPAEIYDRVNALAGRAGTAVARAELVGLVPRAVLDTAPPRRWAELDLDEDRTIEARLAARSG